MSEVSVVVVRRRRSREAAERLVLEFAQSGLMRRDFCARHGLSVAALDQYGVQGAVERKTGLSGTQILARMNSQTADGQIESAYAVLGYTIRSSQLRCTHLGHGSCSQEPRKRI